MARLGGGGAAARVGTGWWFRIGDGAASGELESELSARSSRRVLTGLGGEGESKVIVRSGGWSCWRSRESWAPSSSELLSHEVLLSLEKMVIGDGAGDLIDIFGTGT